MGTKVDSAQVKQIEKGKTTETEVIQMFGKPNEVSTAGNVRRLYYSYTKSTDKPGIFSTVLTVITGGLFMPTIHTKTESNSLLVQIENNVVKDFTYSEGAQTGKF